MSTKFDFLRHGEPVGDPHVERQRFARGSGLGRPERRAALRVDVSDLDLPAELVQRDGRADGAGGLADAALHVRHGDDAGYVRLIVFHFGFLLFYCVSLIRWHGSGLFRPLRRFDGLALPVGVLVLAPAAASLAGR